MRPRGGRSGNGPDRSACMRAAAGPARSARARRAATPYGPAGRGRARRDPAAPAERRREIPAESRRQGLEHRLVHLVAACADVRTDRRHQAHRAARLGAQRLDRGRHHAAGQPPPAGVDRSHRRAGVRGDQDGDTVGGHDAHRDPRESRHHRICSRRRRAHASRRLRHPIAVHLLRPPQSRRRSESAHAEAVLDADGVEQLVPERVHRATSRSASASSRLARSAGSGASKRSRSPRRGCSKPSTAACSAGRPGSAELARPRP